ncbi:MAG: hypothetical protein HC929_14825 [Leptolyngbyaceae cyanobacterium SM2_5_2]|nr:hypothetical protein [Leptolyngbyaceae cyanobacterium SM2_5_2]
MQSRLHIQIGLADYSTHFMNLRKQVLSMDLRLLADGFENFVSQPATSSAGFPGES